MTKRVQPSWALTVIEAVLGSLSDAYGSLPAELRFRLDSRYARFRAAYAGANSATARGQAAAQLLSDLAQEPLLRAVVDAWIAHARERAARHDLLSDDPFLLDRLPPRLQSPPATATAPPAPSDARGPATMPARSPVTAPPALAAAEPPATPRSWRGFEAAPAPAATRSSATPAAPRALLLRYPQLDCQEQALIGQRMSLYIQLRTNAPTGMPALAITDTDAPAHLPELEAVVRARGFEIEGSDTRMLTVRRDGDTEERVVLIPRRSGEQEIRVAFYQHRRYLGEARRVVLVVDQPGVMGTVGAQPAPPPAIALCNGLTPPDVDVRIMLDRHDRRTLYFEAHAISEAVGYNHAPMGQITLQTAPFELFQSIYGELTSLARVTPSTPADAAAQQRRLERLGNQLWSDLFPPELQQAYWSMRDQVRTVQITSDEPWIPWELAKPFCFDEQGRRIDDPFLCEQFDIARWLAGPGPADQVLASRLRAIAPTTTNLPSLQAELQFLEQIGRLRSGLVSDPPYSDVLRVVDLLENGNAHIVHIAAHGNFDASMPDNSAILLDGGALRPSDIVALFGGARPRPLIFINACYGAQAAFGLTGLGGWAERLVRRARVGAFIGAAWEVNDRLALLFAQAFYEALLRDGRPLAAAFRQARLCLREAAPANSTWLAYVLYADPNACVEVVPAV